jgi:hypothetical protein
MVPEDAQAMREYHQARYIFSRAKSQNEIVEATYLLAQTANRVIDSIVDTIFVLEKSTPPEPIVRALQESSSTMITQLLQTSRMPFQALEQALARRFQLESQELARLEQQSQERADFIGFLRLKTESAENMVEGDVAPMAIGFGQRSRSSDGERSPGSKEISDAASGSVGDGLRPANNPRGPIGFVYGLRPAGDPGKVESQPMGFVHFKEAAGTPADRPRIQLNLLTGLFEVVRNCQAIGYCR